MLKYATKPVKIEQKDRFTVYTYRFVHPAFPPSKTTMLTKFWVDAENERVMWCHPPASLRRWQSTGKNACGVRRRHCETVYFRGHDLLGPGVVSIFLDDFRYEYGECLACHGCMRHAWLFSREGLYIDG